MTVMVSTDEYPYWKRVDLIEKLQIEHEPAENDALNFIPYIYDLI